MDINVVDLGCLAYEPCLEVQRSLVEAIATGSKPSTLLFVEHDPVLTLGASFHPENLLLPLDEYAARGIQVLQTDRGGDVTYHGPGQLVIYPIFRLEEVGKDLHQWLRNLEETMLQTVAAFGLEGRRFPPHTGAWVGDKKVAAIGIKVRRWVSMHGIALNCNNDLAAFETIIPCGIQGYGVTSLSQETGERVSIDNAKPVVAEAFRNVFNG